MQANMENKQDDVKIADITHDLTESHRRATPGTWQEGRTSHETISVVDKGEPYRVAEFRHSDDALFCDLAHRFVPRLIKEIQDYQQLGESKQKTLPMPEDFIAEVMALVDDLAIKASVYDPLYDKETLMAARRAVLEKLRSYKG